MLLSFSTNSLQKDWLNHLNYLLKLTVSQYFTISSLGLTKNIISSSLQWNILTIHPHRRTWLQPRASEEIPLLTSQQPFEWWAYFLISIMESSEINTQRWDFIKENKKVRKKKETFLFFSWSRKCFLSFFFFFLVFLLSCFLL